MSLVQFLESINGMPAELERNFKLMTDLDHRTSEVMQKIDDCVEKYESTKSKKERKEIREQSDDLFSKLSSYANDKQELSQITYDMIDRSIKRLELVNPDKLEARNMPVDPNEPLYCLCRSISHGDMIACENRDCTTEWFHYSCVGLVTAPKGNWYCQTCLDELKKARQKKRAKARRR